MRTLELVCNFNFNTGLVQGKNTVCALLTCVYIASYNKRLNEMSIVSASFTVVTLICAQCANQNVLRMGCTVYFKKLKKKCSSA